MTNTDQPSEKLRWDRNSEVARRAEMFRIYRTAGAMRGFLQAAMIRYNAITPELDAALTAMDQLLPYAACESLGDLRDVDSPEARELGDAVRAAAAEWDAMIRGDEEYDEEGE